MPKVGIMPEIPDSNPDRKLSHRSGWCATQHHRQCPFQFSFGKCGCECHKEGKK
jgi:hypothetical protein